MSEFDELKKRYGSKSKDEALKEKLSNGGSVHPCKIVLENVHDDKTIHSHYYIDYNGMTLRDYFAAKAMQGLIQNIDSLEESIRIKIETSRVDMAKKFAEISFDFADAMIEERNKIIKE